MARVFLQMTLTVPSVMLKLDVHLNEHANYIIIFYLQVQLYFF